METVERLRTTFTRLENDSNVRRIVFTGTGDAFASGANLREIARLNEATAREFGRRGQSLMQRIYHSKKMTVAAINGFCMGGALDLAASCRRRVAAPTAVFAHPGVGLGIITGWSGTQLLPRLLGEARALDLLLTARRVTANEALRIRLIDAIADDPLRAALANDIN